MLSVRSNIHNSKGVSKVEQFYLKRDEEMEEEGFRIVQEVHISDKNPLEKERVCLIIRRKIVSEKNKQVKRKKNILIPSHHSAKKYKVQDNANYSKITSKEGTD